MPKKRQQSSGTAATTPVRKQPKRGAKSSQENDVDVKVEFIDEDKPEVNKSPTDPKPIKKEEKDDAVECSEGEKNNSMNGNDETSDQSMVQDDDRGDDDDDDGEEIVDDENPSVELKNDDPQSPPPAKKSKPDQKSSQKSQSSSKEKKKPKTPSKSSSNSKESRNKGSAKRSESTKGDESDSSEEHRKESESEDYDVDYFRRMFHRTKARFHLATDKELFVENLWENIKGKELDLATHKYSSFCLCWFIKNVDDLSKIRGLAEVIDPEKFTIDFLADDYSVLVCESIMEVLIEKLANEENYKTDTSKWILEWIESVAKFVMNHLNALMKNYSNNNSHHILLTIIEALGGIQIGRYWCRKNMRLGGIKTEPLTTVIERDIALKELPQSFKHYLRKLTKALVIDPSDEAVCETLFCQSTNLAQYLLFVLKIRYSDLCQMVVKKMTEALFSSSESTLNSIIQSTNGAYIVEILLLVASESRLSKIWTKHLKGDLKHYWNHDISNFIVQRLIDASKEEKLFAEVCQELIHDLPSLFKANRNSIPVCLSKACRDHPKMQFPFLTALMKAFSCYETEEKQLKLVPSILFAESKSDRNVWLHGSLIVQNSFWFEDPYKLCKSLLAMTTSSLLQTCCDCSGSHVVEAFLRSTTVKLRYKSEFVERLLGNYPVLAYDKYGGRVVEIIMRQSTEQVQATITEEIENNRSRYPYQHNGWFKPKNARFPPFKREWHNPGGDRDGIRRKRKMDDFSPVKHHRDRFSNDGGGDRGRFVPRRSGPLPRRSRGGGPPHYRRFSGPPGRSGRF